MLGSAGSVGFEVQLGEHFCALEHLDVSPLDGSRLVGEPCLTIAVRGLENQEIMKPFREAKFCEPS